MPMGDPERRARVQACLQPIVVGRCVPVVALTGRRGSWANKLPWCQPRIFVSRRSVDEAAADALSGEVAHEYAHVLAARESDQERLELALQLSIFPLGIAGLISALIAIRPPIAPHPHSWAPLIEFLAVVAVVLASLFVATWFSRRQELRADRRAAELLGSPDPVIAMLRRIQAQHPVEPWWLAIWTHPLTATRIKALQALFTTPSPADHPGAGPVASSPVDAP